MNTLQSKHEELAALIYSQGEKHHKKHGYWVRVKLSDEQSVVMDSWNSAIHLKQGVTECDYWIGFNGKPLRYYGLIFGGFNSKATSEEYESIITRIKEKLK